MVVIMDKTDPVCGMKGTIKAYDHYFCSEYCISKYEKEHNISRDSSPSCTIKPKKWYKERLFIVGTIVIILLVIGYFIPSLNPFFKALVEYIKLIGNETNTYVAVEIVAWTAGFEKHKTSIVNTNTRNTSRRGARVII